MSNTVQIVAETLSGFGETVKEVLAQAATIVGEAVMHLYGVLIRQQIVRGIQNLVIFVALSAAGVISYRVIRRVREEKGVHDVDKWFMYAFLGAVTLLTMWRAIEFLNVGIAYLVNPEYQAIMEAAQLIQTLK